MKAAAREVEMVATHVISSAFAIGVLVASALIAVPMLCVGLNIRGKAATLVSKNRDRQDAGERHGATSRAVVQTVPLAFIAFLVVINAILMSSTS
jgi:hypothetical protein